MKLDLITPTEVVKLGRPQRQVIGSKPIAPMSSHLFRLVYLICGLAIALGDAAAQSIFTPYEFNVLAGSGYIGSGDGTGFGAQFYSPQGVAVDNAGNIYIADTENHTLRKVS